MSENFYGSVLNAQVFAASCVALLVIGLTFATRGDIIGVLGVQFALTNEELGWIAGSAFWGFTAFIFIGGHLCDLVGMGRLLKLACLAHIVGIFLTIFAGGFWALWCATLCIGAANALLEAAINPLVATNNSKSCPNRQRRNCAKSSAAQSPTARRSPPNRSAWRRRSKISRAAISPHEQAA